MNKLISSFVFLALAGWQGISHAEQLVSPSILTSTENGVFMDNGRYFVAGVDGIHEVKTASDNSSNCQLDPISNYTVCEVVSNQFEGDTCFFSGMTTDNTYLYAACTIAADGPLGAILPPKRAVLFRLKPNSNSTVQVKTTDFQNPAWYNGMTMLNNNTILMTPSALFGGDTAIAKLSIVNHSSLQIQVSEWLPGSPLYLLPNGLEASNGYVYFVGGQNLFRIKVLSNGSAGTPVLIFQTTVNQVLDDLAIDGNWIVVSNHSAINGLGINTLTRVHKSGLLMPQFIPTWFTQISSVVIDPGTFFEPGSYVSTSFANGGVHRYFD